jgi:hypothetical protein
MRKKEKTRKDLALMKLFLEENLIKTIFYGEKLKNILK